MFNWISNLIRKSGSVWTEPVPTPEPCDESWFTKVTILDEIPMTISKEQFDRLYDDLSAVRAAALPHIKLGISVSEQGYEFTISNGGKTVQEMMSRLKEIYEASDWKYNFQ
jgi:hypothetical protein